MENPIKDDVEKVCLLNQGERFIVFRAMVGLEESARIVHEVMSRHKIERKKAVESTRLQDEWSEIKSVLENSKKSICLNLGIGCGDDLRSVLPKAVAVARRAFDEAVKSLAPMDYPSLEVLARNDDSADVPLTGVALLYGPKASMTAHYDAPTQPNQLDEWLVMMTFGNTVHFQCNDHMLDLKSGDVLVMDSMAVLHGVIGIDANELVEANRNVLDRLEQEGLPLPCRIGILLWHGRTDLLKPTGLASDDSADQLDSDCMSHLFDCDSGDDS